MRALIADRSSERSLLTDHPAGGGLPSRRRGYAALVVAVSIWGGSFVASRIVVQQLPPLTIVATRFFLAALLLLGVVAVRDRRLPTVPTGLRGHVVAFGFTLVTLSYSLEFIGLRRTSSGDASTLFSLTPLFALVLGRLWLKERVGRLGYAGIAIAAAGAWWITRAGMPIGLSDPVGDSVLLAAVALGAWANMLGKRDSGRMDALAHLGFGFGVGSLMLSPVAVHEWLGVGGAAPLTSTGVVAFVYLLVLGTAVAYVAFFYGLRIVGLSAGSVMLYFMAPITILLAAAILHESLTWQRLAACAVVTAGALLTTMPAGPVRPRPATPAVDDAPPGNDSD